MPLLASLVPALTLAAASTEAGDGGDDPVLGRLVQVGTLDAGQLHQQAHQVSVPGLGGIVDEDGVWDDWLGLAFDKVAPSTYVWHWGHPVKVANRHKQFYNPEFFEDEKSEVKLNVE